MWLERVKGWKSQTAIWDGLENLKMDLRALEAEEVNICLCLPQICARVCVSGLRDLHSEPSAKAFPPLLVSVWPRAQGPGPPSPGLTQARGMLEECQDMTESRSSGGGPLCWETNQNPEPKYTSISLCYFPDEKGQTAKEFVSKVQMPPHFCGSLPRPCYCSVGTPLFFDYRKAPGGFYLMRSDE